MGPRGYIGANTKNLDKFDYKGERNCWFEHRWYIVLYYRGPYGVYKGLLALCGYLCADGNMSIDYAVVGI